MMMRTIILLAYGLLMAVSSATLLWDEEGVNTLSDNPFDPTFLGEFALGENSIQGTINEGGGFSADVFTFIIPAGVRLETMRITLELVGTDVPGAHFLAFKDSLGAFDDTASLLFATLISSALNGENILELETDGGDVAMGEGLPNPMGYELPLEAGEYTLWFQETDQTVIHYTMSFGVVPEPRVLVLLLVAFGYALKRRIRLAS